MAPEYNTFTLCFFSREMLVQSEDMDVVYNAVSTNAMLRSFVKFNNDINDH